MENKNVIERLEHKGIKPTANRILVLKALLEKRKPMKLADIEDAIINMDKSSIFRVLTIFLNHDVVHSFEDGKGILNYELCESEGECRHTDSHIHFYCESCCKSFCLEDIVFPHIDLPDGFTLHSFSFVVKGECPACKKANKHI